MNYENTKAILFLELSHFLCIAPNLRNLLFYVDKNLLLFLHLASHLKTNHRYKLVLQRLEDSFNYVVYPLDTDVVLECSKIEKIRDPHDRIIISTARLLNAKVISKDDKIVKSGLVETVF